VRFFSKKSIQASERGDEFGSAFFKRAFIDYFDDTGPIGSERRFAAYASKDSFLTFSTTLCNTHSAYLRAGSDMYNDNISAYNFGIDDTAARYIGNDMIALREAISQLDGKAIKQPMRLPVQKKTASFNSRRKISFRHCIVIFGGRTFARYSTAGKDKAVIRRESGLCSHHQRILTGARWSDYRNELTVLERHHV
jgi:hypothetical protein